MSSSDVMIHGCHSFPALVFLTFLIFNCWCYSSTTAAKDHHLASTTVSSNAITIKVAVDQVCALTKNKDFCTDHIGDDESVATDSLEALSAKLINEAYVYQAQNAIQTIDKLLAKHDAQYSQLKYCHERYESANADLNRAGDLLIKKDYNGLNKLAPTIANYATDCEKAFTVPDTSPLTQMNDYFFNTVDILVATSTLLLIQGV